MDVKASFQKGWLIVFTLPFLQGFGPVTDLLAQPVSFTKMATLVSPAPLSIDRGHFNADKHLDLVTCGKTADGKGVATVFINSGSGNFTAGINFQCDEDPISVKTGLIDSDQKTDFAVLNAGARNISIYVGDGNGFFDLKNKVKVPRNPTAFALADIDGDGITDMVVSFSDESSKLGLFVGNGGGKFKESTVVELDGEVREIAAGSYGNDTPGDVVVVYRNRENISLLTGGDNGTFLTTRFGMNTEPRIAGLGDFDGNGQLDAVILRTASDEVETIMNEGGNLGNSVKTPVDLFAEGLAVGDFNGDGRTDVATCHLNSKVNIYRNNGTFENTALLPNPILCVIVYKESKATPAIEIGVLPSMVSASLRLIDAKSRLVRSFLDIQSDLGEWVFSVEWNGTNDNDQLVDDGKYFFNYRLGGLLCYRPYEFKL